MKTTAILETAFAALILAVASSSTQAAVIMDASLVAWWDASDVNNDSGATNPVNGAAVTTWRDKSGNGFDLNAGGNGTYNTSAIGGQAALEFGTGQWLYTNGLISAEQLAGANRDQLTVFMVLNRQGGIVWSKWETSGANRVGFEGGNRFDMVNDGLGQLGGTDITGAWTLYEGLKSPTDQSIFLNGGLDATKANNLALTAGTMANYVVGANNTANGLSADIDFAEILIYNRALSDTERNEVGFYLADKYGIASQYVPEPGATALFGLGLAAFVLRRQRR